MNTEYVFEFRSIDPARRRCATSEMPQFVHGFNQNLLNNADKNIPPEDIVALKSGFGDSNKLTFLIKPYQRGFRWDAHDNVRKLLEDLYSYSENKSSLFEKTRVNYLKDLDESEFDFYCLQTLTVKNGDKESFWEVIDGQQRLTCVFLIYMVLSAFCGPVNTPYEILYQRGENEFSLSEKINGYFKKLASDRDRDVSPRDILQNNNLTQEEKNDWFKKLKKDTENLFNKEDNITGSYIIDSYYVKSAIIEIMKFVSDGKDQKQIETLLDCIKRNTYFLWYAVPDKGLSSEDVFIKINSGAIPLTNAELIKSLVLRSGNGDVKQKSRRWEDIERGLSQDELWSFVAGDYSSDTRIDLLLDVYARTRNKSVDTNNYPGNSSKNPYALFDWYNIYSTSEKEEFSEKVLKGIQDIFDRIAEWYDDVVIYHYIGLLSVYQKLGFKYKDEYKNQQELLTRLLSDAENPDVTKSEFVDRLKEKIGQCLTSGLKEGQSPVKLAYLVEDSDQFNNDFLSYEDDKKRVEAILWLLNIYETVESTDNKTEDEKKRYRYKDSICRRFPFSEALSGNWSLEHIFPQHPDDKEKEAVQKYDEALKGLGEKKHLNEDEVHSIKNLALLKRSVNTSLQNEMLNKKRNRLIKAVGDGSFVPCSTINAFMLYYNILYGNSDEAEPENHQSGVNWNYWTLDNAENYKKKIIDCLNAVEGENV